jgi:hypothetical protein
MNKIWAILEEIPDIINISPPPSDVERADDSRSCAIYRPDIIDITDYEQHASTTRFDLSNITTRSDYFDSDYFTCNRLMFVSERMRGVMALDPAEAKFIDVDASRSPRVLGLMNYQIMEPCLALDVFVPPTIAETRRSLAASAAAELANRQPPSGGIKVRDDLPVHDLFYEGTVRCLMCSDAFALRVLRSTCDGMCFADPGHMYGSNMRFRTLRGIEEDLGWDEKTLLPITRLVEAAD